jgi:hypothetical protein
MEPQMPTSFIPKRVMDRPERPTARPTGLLLIIAVLILIISLVLWGGTYFYQGFLDKQVKDLEASVESARKALDQPTIVQFQRLDNKLKVAGELLDKHISLVPVLRMLEELTLPTVGYTKFDFKSTSISMEGVAASYEDVAIQAEIFGKDKRIQSFVFSDLDLDNNGKVIFKLTIIPEAGLTSYSNLKAI